MASKLKRLDELDGPPAIGKWYLVPHVKQAMVGCPEVSWEVPVLGHAHADPELGVSVKHLHFDTRFLSRALIKDLRIKHQVDTRVVPVEDGPSVYRISDGKVFLKRARCARLHTRWPELHTKSNMMTSWAKRYRGKALLKGHICPHRGFDVSNVVPDKDGNIVYPLHGLKFCGKTGKNVHIPVVPKPNFK